jgi:hypothetical protein
LRATREALQESSFCRSASILKVLMPILIV